MGLINSLTGKTPLVIEAFYHRKGAVAAAPGDTGVGLDFNYLNYRLVF